MRQENSLKKVRAFICFLGQSHLGRPFPVFLLNPDDALDPAAQLVDVRHELVIELETFGRLDSAELLISFKNRKQSIFDICLDEEVFICVEGPREGTNLCLPGGDEVGDDTPRRGVLGVHLRQRREDVLLRTQVLLDHLTGDDHSDYQI